MTVFACLLTCFQLSALFIYLYFILIHLFMWLCLSVAAHGIYQLWHAESLTAACELIVTCGISFADQVWNLGPLHWEGRVIATIPPGKSCIITLDRWSHIISCLVHYFKDSFLEIFCKNSYFSINSGIFWASSIQGSGNRNSIRRISLMWQFGTVLQVKDSSARPGLLGLWMKFIIQFHCQKTRYYLTGLWKDRNERIYAMTHRTAPPTPCFVFCLPVQLDLSPSFSFTYYSPGTPAAFLIFKYTKLFLTPGPLQVFSLHVIFICPTLYSLFSDLLSVSSSQ